MVNGSLEQIVKFFLMAVIVTGSFGAASGMVIWAIKSYLNLKTKIPRAACAYITMTDLKEHCREHQKGYKEIMETKLDAAIGQLTARLKQGDKIFEDHRIRLRELEKSLSLKILQITKLHKDLRQLLDEKTSGQREQIPGP